MSTAFKDKESDDRCSNCLTNNHEVRVKCNICSDMLLCLECFSNGVELGNHLKTHPYSLYDPGCFPLFTQDWSGLEEIQLLEALEESGFGDWEQCTNYIAIKTAGEIAAHFEEFHLSGIMGDAVKGLLRDPTFGNINLSPSLTVAPMRVDLSKEEGLELGYMPLRDDFEREYDNTAETLISKLVATHNDEPIEADLKFAQVEIYNKRLKDRALRKKIAREYGLVCPKQTQYVMKGKKLDQKDLRQNMQAYARFLTYNQFEKLACGVTREEKLRQKITELRAFRKEGVRKIDDCREFEVNKMKRERRKREEKIGNTPPKRLSYNSLRSLGTDTKSTQRGTNDAKDLKDLIGFKCLSDNEKELCNSLQLPPQKYLSVKLCIIREKVCQQMGMSCTPILDVSQTTRSEITEYLKTAGFIPLAT